MAEILSLEGTTVKIGTENGKVTSVPIASLAFANPVVGDKVSVYKDGEKFIIKRVSSAHSDHSNHGDRRTVSKVAYILLCFFLGWLGIHRFMRGQVGIGICMILFGWLTAGIWWLVDFIISLTKLSAYSGSDTFVFTPDGRWVK